MVLPDPVLEGAAGSGHYADPQLEVEMAKSFSVSTGKRPGIVRTRLRHASSENSMFNGCQRLAGSKRGPAGFPFIGAHWGHHTEVAGSFRYD
jgi:hypothetical protein